MEWWQILLGIIVIVGMLCVAGLCIPQSNAMYGPQDRKPPTTKPPEIRKVNKK